MKQKLAITFFWKGEKIKTEILRSVSPEVDEAMIYKFYAIYRHMVGFSYDEVWVNVLSNS